MSMSMENKVSAGFFVRLFAYAIDSMIAALAVSIVKFPLSIAAGSIDFLSANFLFHYTIVDVIAYVGVAAYFVLLTYFAHTTIGKMMFRLEVVTKDGSWSFINILYRETIGRFLSSLLCIGYFATIITKDHQGFHDMLCNTCVVYKKMQKVKEEPTKVVEQRVEPQIRSVAPVNPVVPVAQETSVVPVTPVKPKTSVAPVEPQQKDVSASTYH